METVIKRTRSRGTAAPVVDELPVAVEEVSASDDEDRIIAKYMARATSPGKAIRAFCVVCMGGQPKVVAQCTAPKCALYPFRMGKNPFHARAKHDTEENEDD